MQALEMTSMERSILVVRSGRAISNYHIERSKPQICFLPLGMFLDSSPKSVVDRFISFACSPLLSLPIFRNRCKDNKKVVETEDSW